MPCHSPSSYYRFTLYTKDYKKVPPQQHYSIMEDPSTGMDTDEENARKNGRGTKTPSCWSWAMTAEDYSPPPPPQDEDIRAAKKPRLGTSMSVLKATDVDVHADVGAASQTTTVTDTLKTFRAPRRRWTPEEDAKLIDSVKIFGKDWLAAADRVSGRTNIQCYHRWVDCLDPLVDRGPRQKWTPVQDTLLASAIKKHGKRWVEIAKLVPGRNNRQCRLRWADNLGPNINRTIGKWIAEEDAMIIDAVKKCGNDWVAVAALVPGRTNVQCRERWVECLDPDKGKNGRTGKWTAEEDAKLTDAKEKHGDDWATVAALVSSRTTVQCRKRWTFRLNRAAEEDAKLLGAIKKHGKDWVAVATLVPGRTNAQCRDRWTRHKDDMCDRDTWQQLDAANFNEYAVSYSYF
jgi:hypothetical protein